MKTILLLITISLLTSCASARYKVTRCDVTDGIVHCSTADIKSKRDFSDGVIVSYKDGEFTFQTGKVTTNVSPLEIMAAESISEILKKIQIK